MRLGQLQDWYGGWQCLRAGELTRSGMEMRIKARMRQFMALGAATGLVVLAGGCASIHDHRGYLIDQAVVDSVQPGIDNRFSVERTLGRPTFASQFGDLAWYYVATDTKTVPFHGPHTEKQTVLRIRFDARGNVASVDKAGKERVVSLHPDHKLTPTLGRKRSFFEDMFGNIGTVGAGGGPATGGGSGGGGKGPNGS